MVRSEVSTAHGIICTLVSSWLNWWLRKNTFNMQLQDKNIIPSVINISCLQCLNMLLQTYSHNEHSSSSIFVLMFPVEFSWIWHICFGHKSAFQNLKKAAFWGGTLWKLVEIFQHLGETCCLQFMDERGGNFLKILVNFTSQQRNTFQKTILFIATTTRQKKSRFLNVCAISCICVRKCNISVCFRIMLISCRAWVFFRITNKIQVLRTVFAIEYICHPWCFTNLNKSW